MSTSTSTRHQNGTILGVWAHPDDEAYLSAGLMYRTVCSGGRVVCIHATCGERGTDDPATWPPSRLGPLRAAELEAALSVVGVDESCVLGYPDGGCASLDDEPAIAVIEAAIRRVEPDVVVTFGPDGITGHHDHIAVSRWATAAWLNCRQGELLYATSTESFLDRYRHVHERLGLFDEQSFAIADDEVALTVSLTTDEVAVKRRMLAAHASQTTDLATAMGEQLYRHWYDVETFRRPTAADVARTGERARAA